MDPDECAQIQRKLQSCGSMLYVPVAVYLHLKLVPDKKDNSTHAHKFLHLFLLHARLELSLLGGCETMMLSVRLAVLDYARCTHPSILICELRLKYGERKVDSDLGQ